MRLLIDTNIAIGLTSSDVPLRGHVILALTDPANEVFFSAASVWEAEIKRALGKLTVPESLWDDLGAKGFRDLPITRYHAVAAARLPAIHRDPFDRMLVAQSMAEGMTLVTKDRRLSDYGIPTLW